MANRGIEEAKRYHQTTKHSYPSVRTNSHTLDWDNRPSIRFIPISRWLLFRATSLGPKRIPWRP